jgi:hypothetical protein
MKGRESGVKGLEPERLRVFILALASRPGPFG